MSGSRAIRERFMLHFHQGSCHCVCLVAKHVRNVGRFLVLELPSSVVNVVSAGVAIQEVEVYFFLCWNVVALSHHGVRHRLGANGCLR